MSEIPQPAAGVDPDSVNFSRTRDGTMADAPSSIVRASAPWRRTDGRPWRDSSACDHRTRPPAPVAPAQSSRISAKPPPSLSRSRKRTTLSSSATACPRSGDRAAATPPQTPAPERRRTPRRSTAPAPRNRWKPRSTYPSPRRGRPRSRS